MVKDVLRRAPGFACSTRRAVQRKSTDCCPAPIGWPSCCGGSRPGLWLGPFHPWAAAPLRRSSAEGSARADRPPYVWRADEGNMEALGLSGCLGLSPTRGRRSPHGGAIVGLVELSTSDREQVWGYPR